MVNVILNLLYSALFAVITSITLFGAEGKAIVQKIDEWRTSGDGEAWSRLGKDGCRTFSGVRSKACLGERSQLIAPHLPYAALWNRRR
jgi:hypothetical protein